LCRSFGFDKLDWISVLPIGLGISKIFLHYFSVYRLQSLDYMVGVGAILSGLFFLTHSYLKPVLIASGFLISVGLLKAVIDYFDPFDFFVAMESIAYLLVPFFRYFESKSRIE
jgi:hypothetical protein